MVSANKTHTQKNSNKKGNNNNKNTLKIKLRLDDNSPTIQFLIEDSQKKEPIFRTVFYTAHVKNHLMG